MASPISLILLPFRKLFSCHQQFFHIFQRIFFSKVFHGFFTNFPCSIGTNCHLCTTSLQKDVNRSNDFRQMSAAIILTNGEKRTNEAREEKGFEKSAPTETWLCVSILSCMCLLSCGRKPLLCIYSAPSDTSNARSPFGTRFELWMSFVECEWMKRFAQKLASKKKRFPIWRRRQFISQLTNLPNVFSVAARSPLKRGAFNCHDCAPAR